MVNRQVKQVSWIVNLVNWLVNFGWLTGALVRGLVPGLEVKSKQKPIANLGSILGLPPPPPPSSEFNSKDKRLNSGGCPTGALGGGSTLCTGPRLPEGLGDFSLGTGCWFFCFWQFWVLMLSSYRIDTMIINLHIVQKFHCFFSESVNILKFVK